jgi:hypothetical protein
MAAKIEQHFLATPKLAPSGPMTQADADFQFVPRIDASAMLRSDKRQFSDPLVEDQGQEGECVGESGSSCCESINALSGAAPFQRFSDQFYYNMAKLQSGLRGQGDTGASIRGGLDGARLYGIPHLADWPQVRDPAYYDAAPPDAVMSLGAQHKLGRFERIDYVAQDWQDIKRVLNSAHAEGLRVIAGIKVYRWMFYINGALETHINQPGPIGVPMTDLMGLHAILIEDFDNTLGASGGGSQIMLNSWTGAWGDNGRYACPNVMFANLVFELWAVRSFNGVEVTPAPDAPLAPELIDAYRAAMAGMGLDSFASYEYLRRRNLSHAQMGVVAGYTAEAVDGFAAGNATRLDAWKTF